MCVSAYRMVVLRLNFSLVSSNSTLILSISKGVKFRSARSWSNHSWSQSSATSCFKMPLTLRKKFQLFKFFQEDVNFLCFGWKVFFWFFCQYFWGIRVVWVVLDGWMADWSRRSRVIMRCESRASLSGSSELVLLRMRGWYVGPRVPPRHRLFYWALV